MRFRKFAFIRLFPKLLCSNDPVRFSLFLAFEKQSVNCTKTTNFPPDFYALTQKFIKTKVTSEFALPLYPTVTFSNGSDEIFWRLYPDDSFCPRTTALVCRSHSETRQCFLSMSSFHRWCNHQIGILQEPVLSHPAARIRLRKPVFINLVLGNRLPKSYLYPTSMSTFVRQPNRHFREFFRDKYPAWKWPEWHHMAKA